MPWVIPLRSLTAKSEYLGVMHTRGQHISCINVREKAYLKMSPPINKQLPPSFPAELWYLLGTAVLLSTLRQLEAGNESYLGMLGLLTDILNI